MRRKRCLHLHLLRNLIRFAVISSVTPACVATGWARPATVIGKGVPDDPEAPSPGPSKSGPTTQAARITPTPAAQISARYEWRLLIEKILLRVWFWSAPL